MKSTVQRPFSRFYNIIDHFLTQNIENFYVGFSGGPDSTALLSLLVDHSLLNKKNITACYLNHGVRSETEMQNETDHVKKICQSLGVKLKTGLISKEDWIQLSEEEKLSDEETARVLRYRFFESCMDEKKHIFLLAHNRDDQEETVLMRFFQGAFSGLGGIPFMRDRYCRPLLSYSKKEIIEYLDYKKLEYIQDSTNTQELYLRNSVRLRILPDLEKDFPGIKSSLETLSQRFRDTSALVELAISKAGWIRKEGAWRLPLEEAVQYPKEFFVQSLYQFYKESVRTLHGEWPSQIPYRFFSSWPRNSRELKEAGQKNERIYLNGYGFTAGVNKKDVFFYPRKEKPFRNFYIRIPSSYEECSFEQGEYVLNLKFGSVAEKSSLTREAYPGTICIPRSTLRFPLIWRSPGPGDFIRTTQGKKKVKKIISEVREKTRDMSFSILEDKNGIIAVYGDIGGEIKIVVSDRINYHFFDDFSDNIYYIRIIRNPKGSLSS